MIKGIKRLLVSVVLVVMVLTLVLQSFAGVYPSNNLHVVALGDSIAFGGSGLPGDQWVEDSYSDLLATYLSSKTKKFEYHNLSIPGIDSSAFLLMISNPVSVQNKINTEIQKSEVITLSIGANNLLGPLYAYLYGPPENFNLKEALDAGIAKFKQDWPKILKAIRQINPTAIITVNTVYNPYEKVVGDIYKTNYLCDLGGIYLPLLNSQICDFELIKQYHYKPIDVYSAFDGKIIKRDLTFTYHLDNPDPHPTVKGQTLIFKLHKEYFNSFLHQECNKHNSR